MGYFVLLHPKVLWDPHVQALRKMCHGARARIVRSGLEGWKFQKSRIFFDAVDGWWVARVGMGYIKSGGWGRGGRISILRTSSVRYYS